MAVERIYVEGEYVSVAEDDASYSSFSLKNLPMFYEDTIDERLIISYSREGAVLAVPINILIENLKYSTKFKNGEKLVYKSYNEIGEDYEFLSRILGFFGHSYKPLGFCMFVGCPEVRVTVTKPFSYYL